MTMLVISCLAGLLLIQVVAILVIVRLIRRARSASISTPQSTVIQSYVLNTDRKLDQVVQNAMDAMLRQAEQASELPKVQAPWHE